MSRELMKAVVYQSHVSPAVRVTEVEKPVPTEDQVLIRIRAASINGPDRESVFGKVPYGSRPGSRKNSRLKGSRRKAGSRILGSDIAGEVEAVGQSHTDFKVGDEVFGEVGGYSGGFAEYVCTRGRALAIKPPGLTFAEAAAIPQAGVIALRAIRLKGRVKPGQEVLIVGAGGSAGSFAVQLAELEGAQVTGVDNGEKLEFMRSLGCDRVIDHTKDDFTKAGKRYDLVVDLVAHRSAFACRRVLNPGGTYFFVGGSTASLLQVLFIGPLLTRTSRRNMRLLMVPQNRQDLIAITQLCETGAIVPRIDRLYGLSKAPEALAYVGQGRAKGKVVITLDDSSSSS